MGEETRALVPLEGTVPSTRETTAADELVAQIVQVMDKIEERMRLESPHPSTARRVRGARTIPREFVVALIATVESTRSSKDSAPSIPPRRVTCCRPATPIARSPSGRPGSWRA